MSTFTVLAKGAMHIARLATLATIWCCTSSALLVTMRSATRATTAAKVAIVVSWLVLSAFLVTGYMELVHTLNNPGKK